MAKTRPSVQKRIKESRKIEKAQAKAARKAARVAARVAAAAAAAEGAAAPDLTDLATDPDAASTATST